MIKVMKSENKKATQLLVWLVLHEGFEPSILRLRNVRIKIATIVDFSYLYN